MLVKHIMANFIIDNSCRMCATVGSPVNPVCQEKRMKYTITAVQLADLIGNQHTQCDGVCKQWFPLEDLNKFNDIGNVCDACSKIHPVLLAA